jgi:hypothetical protein
LVATNKIRREENRALEPDETALEEE